MSVEDRVIALIDEGNPIPDPYGLDRDHLDPAAYLESLEQRSSEMTQVETVRQETTDRAPTGARWLVAAVVAILIGTAVLVISQGDEFGPDAALDTGKGFIESFNEGDVEALLATLTADVEVSESYTFSPGTGEFEVLDRAFFEQQMVWATAQGATLTTPECLVTESVTPTEVGVVCEFGLLYAPEKAAGLTPVPTVLTMVVTQDGISQAAFEYPPVFTPEAFSLWVLENYPDEYVGIEYGEWSSVAEAEQDGLLRARYAEEWAASLESDQ